MNLMHIRKYDLRRILQAIRDEENARETISEFKRSFKLLDVDAAHVRDDRDFHATEIK